jgi:hypothetical protein
MRGHDEALRGLEAGRSREFVTMQTTNTLKQHIDRTEVRNQKIGVDVQ